MSTKIFNVTEPRENVADYGDWMRALRKKYPATPRTDAKKRKSPSKLLVSVRKQAGLY